MLRRIKSVIFLSYLCPLPTVAIMTMLPLTSDQGFAQYYYPQNNRQIRPPIPYRQPPTWSYRQAPTLSYRRPPIEHEAPPPPANPYYSQSQGQASSAPDNPYYNQFQSQAQPGSGPGTQSYGQAPSQPVYPYQGLQSPSAPSSPYNDRSQAFSSSESQAYTCLIDDDQIDAGRICRFYSDNDLERGDDCTCYRPNYGSENGTVR